MPRGVYLADGRPEAFSCAPGPVGWRYVSSTLDLACDATFRPVRLAVTGANGAWLRGGGLRLDDGAPVLAWASSANPEVEQITAAEALVHPSPGAWVALLRSAAGPGDETVERHLTVLDVDADGLGALAGRRVLQRVGATAYDAPAGQLLAERWLVDDPDTGRRRELHLAGDVLLSASGGDQPEIELTDLDGPPSAL